MPDDLVTYNGVRMAADHPAKIEASQKLPVLTLEGQTYPRVRFGEEEGDWAGRGGRPCGDCGILRGQYHVWPGCDIEQCPRCGGQIYSCDCEFEDDEPWPG